MSTAQTSHDRVSPITRRDFYKSVAMINREAAVWLHEGVTRDANGDRPFPVDARSRFCEQIRGFLSDIEGNAGDPA